MSHLVFVAVLAAILALIGRGLWWLTLRAASAPVTEGRPGLRTLLAALPALGYAAMVAPMLLEMAGDPTAANLWPLAVAGLETLWLGYALVLRLVLALAGLVRSA